MLALLLTAWLGPCAAQGNELVMATTFSPSATVWIIDRWQKEPGSVMIRTLNRTSASLEQLLDTANAENVDLILTSSPMLLQHLQEHQKLAPFSGAPAASQHLVPESIRSTSVAVAIHIQSEGHKVAEFLISCVFYPVVIGILLSALATLQSI